MNESILQTLISALFPALTAVLGGLFTYLISKRKASLEVDKLYTKEIKDILSMYKQKQDQLLETVDKYIQANDKLRTDIMELKTENSDLIKKNNELISKINELIAENRELKDTIDRISEKYKDIENNDEDNSVITEE